MSVRRVLARYGGKAGVALAVAGGLLLSRESLPVAVPHAVVTRAVLLVGAVLFASRVAFVVIDPDGAVDAGMAPPLRNVEVTVETRGDLWKAAAFDLLAAVVCLGLAVLLPSLPGR
ncbi:hypothetical protein BRC81_04350 [Halobacteriales archaeon QS_1_68_20]|nr:MAG: hypothetical protein BRC81_04350 [Halobacteriales archaeon QS_1_68_20]